MKFLVDMPLPPPLADWLVSQGHEAVHASRIGMALESDDVLLTRAGHEERVVVTADLDFSRLIALAHPKGPGLILFRGGDWNAQDAVARLADALAKIPEGELSVDHRCRSLQNSQASPAGSLKPPPNRAFASFFTNPLTREGAGRGAVR